MNSINPLSHIRGYRLKISIVLGDIPFLQVGVPAILSVYFDVFSGCIQAYIFAMLTMLNVSGAYPADAIAERLAKREARKAKKARAA